MSKKYSSPVLREASGQAMNPGVRTDRELRREMGLRSPRQWVRYRKAWNRAIREDAKRAVARV